MVTARPPASTKQKALEDDKNVLGMSDSIYWLSWNCMEEDLRRTSGAASSARGARHVLQEIKKSVMFT